MTVHLSLHDRLVLASLQLLEQASTTHLQRLCFSQPGLSPKSYGVRTRSKLLRLYRQGLMRRFPSLGTGGWIYLPEGSRATKIDPHTLDVTELYIRLVEAERAGRCEILEWITRERVAGRAADDAYLWMETPAGRRDWHLEVDRDSEDTPQLREKMRAYCRAYEQTNGNFPSVLFVVTFSARRSLEKRRDLIRSIAQRQAEPRLFDAVTINEVVSYCIRET